jgi:serine acetyltransferase/glycosyltransferase involved in cell wall biosynthesis
MLPQVSVVIATHNRHASLRRLLAHLAAQTLPPHAFEVVVVDDGSAEPVADQLEGAVVPAHLGFVRTVRRGPGAARHEGVLLAQGGVVVFVDDDMRLPPDFLAAHLALHREHANAVVLGNILPSESLGELPLFERYHARQLERFRAAASAGTVALRGVHLCTGNVSMPRARYLQVGGFNAALERSEDRELGVRLEKTGSSFVFGEAAASLHESDHTDLEVWLRRAWLYGRFDTKIGRLHPELDNTHPWRFWSLVNPLSRPLIALALAFPRIGRSLARGTYGAAVQLDRAGLVRLAVTLTALTYGLEYFRGMREECGSLGAVRAEIRAWRRRSGGPGIIGSARAALAAVRADYDATRRQRFKYHGEQIPASRIWLDLFRKVGFQMLVCYRLMRFFRMARIPLAPQLVSRFIRHAYGAEIHWDARLAPGISIVHGIGLVLSHAAVVEEGCILFQHVTLGENFDAATGRVGAPRLERDVHVGPGATLLGPITLGERTKVTAGAVLMRTVPADSLVRPPEAQVGLRSPRTRAGAAPEAA